MVKAVRKAAGVAPGERETKIDKAAIDPLAGAPDDGEAIELAAAEKVGRIRADMELLEIKSESLRNRISRAMTTISNLDGPAPLMGPTADEDDPNRKKYRKTLDEHRAALHSNMESWQKDYLETRVEIVRLKHQIDRMPKPLVPPLDPNEQFAEVIRRIERLEARVDRLADLIAAGKGR